MAVLQSNWLYSRRMRLAVILLVPVLCFAQNDFQAGRRAYSAHCSNCHGARGDGSRGPSLRRLTARASDDTSILGIILNGIPATEMPPTRLTEGEALALIGYLKTLRNQPATSRTGGDASRGEVIYRTKGGCAACHMTNGLGGRLGPELTAIGRARSAEYLRQSLVDPGAALPEKFAEYRLVIPMPDNFLMVRAVTAGGRTIEGIRLNEDPFTIQIRDLRDGLHTLTKNDLRQLEKQRRSPMPSFREKLLPAEIEDLVSYLSTLRGGR